MKTRILLMAACAVALSVAPVSAQRIGLQAFGPEFTSGLIVVLESGRSVGLDADWFRDSDQDIVVSAGVPVGEATGYLFAGVGRASSTTNFTGPGEYEATTNRMSAQFTVRSLGVGIGWRHYVARALHNGRDITWQLGVRWVGSRNTPWNQAYRDRLPGQSE